MLIGLSNNDEKRVTLAFYFLMYNRAMSKIEKHLEKWYLENQRPLIFRENREPYRIWVSEIMAQQTQIDTLIPYYINWMNQFKSIDDVANAKEEDILKAWEGLGYYSRARNLQKAAKDIQANHQSKFPQTRDEIIKLAGIGPYTASAIASICFDEKCAAIDGNVKRVLARLFMLDSEGKTFMSEIDNTIIKWMDQVKPHILTQAIMELGALICNKKAQCDICPLNKDCLAYKNDKVNDYPKVKTKLKQKHEHKSVLYLINKDKKIALTLDHYDSLMKGYYRLPEVQQTAIDIKKIKKDTQLTHVFSHKIWDVDFYQLEVSEDYNFEWFDESEIKDLPIITLHRKYLDSKSS